MSITGKKITAEIFLKYFGVYFNIVISVFVFSHMILGSVDRKVKVKISI